MRARVATDRDLDGLVDVMAAAFASDPVWGWAFPERSALERWWRFYLGSALRYPNVWIADDFAAAAAWIPPGGVELTEEEEASVEPLLVDLVGPRAPDLLRLVERFDASHPHEPPHYYLSLLGTHPSERGKGIGMGLLAESLAAIDLGGAPAYLESSNPGNNHRYERQGFRQVGEFNRPDEQHTVATMWRGPGAGASR